MDTCPASDTVLPWLVTRRLLAKDLSSSWTNRCTPTVCLFAAREGRLTDRKAALAEAVSNVRQPAYAKAPEPYGRQNQAPRPQPECDAF